MPQQELTVYVPLLRESVTVPFNHRTLVSHIIGAVALKTGEGSNLTNCNLVCKGAELSYDLRVCALPKSALQTDLIFNCDAPVRFVASSPRLGRVPSRMELNVQLPDGTSRIVIAETYCNVYDLRRLCEIESDHIRLFCDGRMVIDEMPTLAEAYISPASVLKFDVEETVEASSTSFVSDPRKSWKPSASSVQRRTRFLTDMGAGSPSATRITNASAAPSPNSTFRMNQSTASSGGGSYLSRPHDTIQVFVADPMDSEFIHEVNANRHRMVCSLQQFVENPAAFDICCDGQVVFDTATFEEVTRGDDGCHFKFVAK